jgi:hypothetical protein
MSSVTCVMAKTTTRSKKSSKPCSPLLALVSLRVHP